MPKRNPSIASTSCDDRSARARQRVDGGVGFIKRPVWAVGLLIAMLPSVHAAEASRSSVTVLNHALGMDVLWANMYDFIIANGGLIEFNRSIDSTQRACVSEELKKGMEREATSEVIKRLGGTGQEDVDAWMVFLATPAGQWIAGATASHMKGALAAANVQELKEGGKPAPRSFPTPPHSLLSEIQTFGSSPASKRILATYGDLQNSSEDQLRRMMKTMEATCGVKFQDPNF